MNLSEEAKKYLADSTQVVNIEDVTLETVYDAVDSQSILFAFVNMCANHKALATPQRVLDYYKLNPNAGLILVNSSEDLTLSEVKRRITDSLLRSIREISTPVGQMGVLTLQISQLIEEYKLDVFPTSLLIPTNAS